MGSLYYNNLKKLPTQAKDYTFKDLYLDLRWDFINRDIVVDYDDEAIKNSIINIFNTIPGQRFLIPTFGCNLLQYIFQPITDFTASLIANTIFDAITIWEPRVKIANLNVVGSPDQHEYLINLTLQFPKLKRQSNLAGILTEEGFSRI